MPLVMRIDRTIRRRRRFAYAGLAALLAVWPLSALSLGLGEPILKSHLGARLQVQIPLILDDGERADEVRVRLASAADRARFGGSPEDSTVQMRLAVELSGRSGPSISVTSAASVREPALTFVIEVKSNSTRFMREYTVLLDPVNYRAAPETALARAPQTEPAPAPAAALSPTIDGDIYGPIAPGDTLSELGAKLRADRRVSVSQMSIALFQANPQAFIDNNVNHLVAGAYLRVPNRDESTVISSQAARERLYGPVLQPPRTATAMPGARAMVPGMATAPPRPADEPSVPASEEAAADVSATLDPIADKPSSQVLPEPHYRLSILAADPRSDSNIERVISRLSGSKDIAVRDIVARLENARQVGEEFAHINLELRERIAAADVRITKLAAVLRDRNDQIADVLIAIEAKRSPAPQRAATVVTSNDDMPALAEQPEGLLRPVWHWLSQVASQGSPLAWLGALAALCGVWLLIRRSQR